MTDEVNKELKTISEGVSKEDGKFYVISAHSYRNKFTAWWLKDRMNMVEFLILIIVCRVLSDLIINHI